MTEQNPETPAPVATSSTSGGTTAERTPGQPARYAVYDNRFLRYVGDVVTTRKDAAKIAKDRDLSGDDFTIREV